MIQIISAVLFLMIAIVADVFEQIKHVKYHLFGEEHEHQEGELE
jgi:hypothetical protein